MEPEVDFFSSYKAVSNKLKKRFLKKPNVSEAREEFNQLAKTLNEGGCSHYAGFCCLAMARCEQNMANSPGEVQALLQAARHFLQADDSLEKMCCPNFGEHLNCAKNCFELAIKNHITNDLPVMAATLCEEVGSYLENSKRFDEAATYYQRAAELYFQNSVLHLQALKKVMHLKILLGENYNALLIGVEMLQFILEKGAYKSDELSLLGHFAELHCDCEVTVVLLLMLIDPHPLKIRKEFAQILQKYTWAESSCDQTSVLVCNRMNEDLFLLLQSVVMACASKDVSSLEYLQAELRPFLSSLQKSILENVIEEHKHPSGLGF